MSAIIIATAKDPIDAVLEGLTQALAILDVLVDWGRSESALSIQHPTVMSTLSGIQAPIDQRYEALHGP